MPPRLIASLVLGLLLATGSVQPGPTRGQDDGDIGQHVVLQVFPNGDRAGAVTKAAGTRVQGPLPTAAPGRRAVDGQLPARPARAPAEEEQPPAPDGGEPLPAPPPRRPVEDQRLPARPVPQPAEETQLPAAPREEEGSAGAVSAAQRGGAPGSQSAGSFVLKRDTVLDAVAGRSSVINEPNVGSLAHTIFQTGNTYAAVSTDNGVSFSAIDISATFPNSPAPFSRGVCCDQRVVQDPSRGLIVWYMQYLGVREEATNAIRIAVARGADDLAANAWTYWDFTPADFGLEPGTPSAIDHPDMQVSANFLYFTTGVGARGSFNGMAIGRIPLDALRDGAGFTMHTFLSEGTGLIAPVSGATTTMYFGRVTDTSTIRVMTWSEPSLWPTTAAVRVQRLSFREAPRCPGPDGLDPCSRAGLHTQTGWVTSTELGFMWNSPQGPRQGRPYPFVRTVILDRSTLAVVADLDLWSDSYAYIYPAVAVNARGHLGGVVSSAGGNRFPTIHAIIRDDFSPDLAASGWEIYDVATSTHGARAWGDYAGAVAHERYPNTWLGVGHVVVQRVVERANLPHNFWFMRARDDPGDLGASPTSVARGEEATPMPAPPERQHRPER